MIEVAIVLAAIHLIPSECSLYVHSTKKCPDGPGHYEIGKDTKLIAEAISVKAASLYEAVEMAVYAAYEGVNNLDAIGDGGKSYGAWQIRNPNAQLTASQQLSYWISYRDASVNMCGDYTALASGHCGWAKKKIDKRNQVIAKIAEQIDTTNTK